MMNSSSKLSELPLNGINLSALMLLLLLLLELPVPDSPLMHENLPLDRLPTDVRDVLESGQDFLDAYPAELLAKLLFSF
jgi:hypothetical protein